MNKKYYIEYLLHTPFNYTCTNLADHSEKLSHDRVNRFLCNEKFTPSALWDLVQDHLSDHADSVIIADDSVQDKRYSKFIDLVKKQYSGNEHGTVRGINLVNFVHSSGNDGDFFPIDYRIYHPETDGKTKNDHFKEMFMGLIHHKNLQTRTILFDSWYASVENLKLIHRQHWIFFTTLKDNRLVSLSKETGYQHLSFWHLMSKVGCKESPYKLKEMPFYLNYSSWFPQTGTLNGSLPMIFLLL